MNGNNNTEASVAATETEERWTVRDDAGNEGGIFVLEWEAKARARQLNLGLGYDRWTIRKDS